MLAPVESELRKRFHTSGDEPEQRQLPAEFRRGAETGAVRSTGVEHSLLVLSLIFFSLAFFVPFLSKPFASQKNIALRAGAFETGEALGIVTYMDDFSETSGSQRKDLFGWGALDLVSRASQALAPHLQKCRAQLNVAKQGLAFRFDVKIDVKKPGFVVHGLVSGQEDEPEMATCLRDTINTLSIADFASLRDVAPKSYKLRLGVALAHGTDGGVP
ncbi:MAG: hypothetical protein RIR26_2532 [Pseudomonadota bacterium]|jgi:hypothetical protein